MLANKNDISNVYTLFHTFPLFHLSEIFADTQKDMPSFHNNAAVDWHESTHMCILNRATQKKWKIRIAHGVSARHMKESNFVMSIVQLAVDFEHWKWLEFDCLHFRNTSKWCPKRKIHFFKLKSSFRTFVDLIQFEKDCCPFSDTSRNRGRKHKNYRFIDFFVILNTASRFALCSFSFLRTNLKYFQLDATNCY